MHARIAVYEPGAVRLLCVTDAAAMEALLALLQELERRNASTHAAGPGDREIDTEARSAPAHALPLPA